MHLLYNAFVFLVSLLFVPVSRFSTKIKHFVDARKNWEKKILDWQQSRKNQKPILCLHCASLGEYEMIVPIISQTQIQEKYHCVVSFFSESGYKNMKNYGLEIDAFYLPIDTPKNMKTFLQLLNPSVFVLVKNELWLNLLHQLNHLNIKTLLVNGIFRKNQFLFSTWGKAWQKELKKFDAVFVQNKDSYQLLEQYGFRNIRHSGDLRFDRVLQIKKNAQPIDKLARFAENNTTLIAGSSWPEEEDLLLHFLTNHSEKNLKLIIAPHDVSEKHIAEIHQKFRPLGVSLYTDEEINRNNQVLVINGIGVLSNAYQYADVAIIGGAFGKGLHNVLEAAVWGLPVVCGSNISRFPEALEMQQNQLLFAVDGQNQFDDCLKNLLVTETFKTKQSEIKQWVEAKSGNVPPVISKLISEDEQNL
ncbi:MAG: hypothetical protein H6607_00335 [Flavobacteriales bacterium]|nr:hypothetical protein [Flavobacteriales bacterium]